MYFQCPSRNILSKRCWFVANNSFIFWNIIKSSGFYGKQIKINQTLFSVVFGGRVDPSMLDNVDIFFGKWIFTIHIEQASDSPTAFVD